MKLRYILGDATAPVQSPAIICHVCNDVGAFAKGFVAALNKKYPVVRKRYQSLKGQYALGLVQILTLSNGLRVANMIAQHGLKPSTTGIPPIRYDALRTCLTKINEYAEQCGATLAMPRIGSKLAGGKWDEIEKIIKETMKVDVYVYTLDAEKGDWPMSDGEVDV